MGRMGAFCGALGSGEVALMEPAALKSWVNSPMGASRAGRAGSRFPRARSDGLTPVAGTETAGLDAEEGRWTSSGGSFFRGKFCSSARNRRVNSPGAGTGGNGGTAGF